LTNCYQLAHAAYLPAESALSKSKLGPSHAGCLALQAVGFTLPAPSPAPRCALTTPFHLCLCPDESEPSAVYFLRHFPAGCPGWPLATTVALSCSDFPPPLLRPCEVKLRGRPPDPLFFTDYLLFTIDNCSGSHSLL